MSVQLLLCRVYPADAQWFATCYMPRECRLHVRLVMLIPTDLRLDQPVWHRFDAAFDSS